METPNRNSYIYCAKHDILFNPRLKEEADEENEKLKAAGLLERVETCPMCKQEFELTILRLHSPRHQSFEELDFAHGTDH